jgi:hypothetical protein
MAGMAGKHNTVTRELAVLQVEPLDVVFKDIEESVQYIQVVTIRNLGSTVRRIRWVPPKTSEFAFEGELKTAIAPGLCVQVEVKFLTRTPADYTDRFEIVTEDFRYEVPLTAQAPCADLQYEPAIEYGSVITGRPHHQEITICNIGSRPGGFHLSCLNSIIRFVPPEATVAAGAELKVRVDVNSETAESVNELLVIKTTGESTLRPRERNINLYATIVKESLHLLLDGHETSSVDFGKVYHGRTRTIFGRLVNDGPLAVPFQSIHQRGDDEVDQPTATLTSPADSVKSMETPLQIAPFAGSVPAFGELAVELTFSPALFDERTGYMCTRQPEAHALPFEAAYNLECDELGQSIVLRMKGIAIRPALRMKPDVLYFGECPVNERRDIVVSLHNSHRLASLDWNIPRVPHMHVEPSSGNLAPQQRQDVIVTYLPKQLGHFEAQLQLQHCHQLYSLPLSCFGEAPVIAEKQLTAKGLEKTGRDFEPVYQYVTPNSMQLGIPHRRNLQKLTKIMKSSLWEDSNASLALDSIMLDLPNPTPYSLSPSAMQDHVRNKQKYNLMLRQQRFRRKQLEKFGTEGPPPVDIFCEGDVDRGMKPGQGLRSPRLQVDEIPVDKLWLQRPVDDESATRGVTGIRFIHDENRFVKKKFKSAPTTQAEVHDASAKLEIWQLQLISTGPKILDFGTIYVKSVVTKSFTVFNDLPQAILVALQYETEELARSTPVSQLIPSAQVAGFDITLCSSTPQSFSRQVSYTLNGHHTYKFLCKAEITPVELQLSRSELTFRFG